MLNILIMTTVLYYTNDGFWKQLGYIRTNFKINWLSIYVPCWNFYVKGILLNLFLQNRQSHQTDVKHSYSQSWIEFLSNLSHNILYCNTKHLIPLITKAKLLFEFDGRLWIKIIYCIIESELKKMYERHDIY